MSTLPITAYRDRIITTIHTSPVTILVAETGAGKSTQVPQYLLDARLRIVVTQPRRMAAELVAERVASERGTRLGGEVGYRLGGGVRVDSGATRCLFCTEGLALVRELMSRDGDVGYDVLVLDEVHEWSRDMEILVAWSKRQLRAGARFRLVIMSATMEAEKLAAYFDGAPVISVPGRMYPVEVRVADALTNEDRNVWGPIARDVATLVACGRNVLVFAPGKAEIADLCGKLGKLDAVVLPLHGELDKTDRAACFRGYDRPKVIVSTNVAQTSVTIDDIDAVVDSGLERRTDVSGGVEGLRLRLISAADAAQRKGRAGRTKPGIYIDHARNAVLCTPGVGERAEWPTAEIMRVLLDQAVLRLAMAGIDLEDLDLFHQPERREIHAAKATLRALGCIADDRAADDGAPAKPIVVTEIGARVARMPTGVRTGRMLIEAEKRGCIADVTTIAAIVECGGIVDGKAVDDKTKQPLWRRYVTDTASDHVTMLRIYERGERAGRAQWRAMGLHGKGMAQAIDTRKSIADATARVLKAAAVKGSRDDVVKCVIAGLIDQLRNRATNRWGEFCYGYEGRKLGRESAINAGAAPYVVGMPFDVSTAKGGTLHLLEMSSAVNLDWLAEIAPEMITVVVGTPEYDAATDAVTAVANVAFRGEAIRTDKVAVTGAQASAALSRWIRDAMRDTYYARAAQSEPHRMAIVAAYNARRLAVDMNRRLGEQRYDAGSDDGLRTFVDGVVGSCVRLADVPADRLRVEVVSDVDAERVRTLHPDAIDIGGRECAVNYDSDPPTVRIDADVWRALPDEIRTPGGRLLEAVVGYGYSVERGTDVRAIKVRMAAVDRARAFRDWYPRPDVDGDGIVEAKYGEGASGHPWIAYGVLGEHGASWYEDRTVAVEALADATTARAYGRLRDAYRALPYGHPLRERGDTMYRDSPLADIVACADDCAAEVASIATLKAAEDAEIAAGAAKVIAAHAAARPAVYSPESCGTVDADVAGRVFAFVRDAIATRGDARTVATILRCEADAAYGRARRADALAEHFAGVDTRGLDWKQGADIVVVAAWAESIAGEAPRPTSTVVVATAQGKRPQQSQKQRKAAPTVLGGGGTTLGDMLRARGQALT